MNFRNVFFFGQYGEPDRMKACAWDHHGVWRRLDGSYMPQPKLIDGVLVCAPGDLIERLGSSAVKNRIEAVCSGRKQDDDGGRPATPVGVPRLPGRAEDAAENKGEDHVCHGENGARTWSKPWGSKRWHAMKSAPGGEDLAVSLCGRQINATRSGPIPGWHVACAACLHVIHRKRLNRNPYSK